MKRREAISRAREQVKLGLGLGFEDKMPFLKGRFIFDMKDAKTGERLAYFEKENLITLDCGVLVARLMKNSLSPIAPNNNGVCVLAIGTGATGNILNPDAPQATQRILNTQIQQKPFASTNYIDASGVAVSYPTHVVDYTATFSESEAVGPLNEMGLKYAANGVTSNPLPPPAYDPVYDPTFDVNGVPPILPYPSGPYDLLINYSTFAVISKPSTATLTITWRISS